MLARHSWSVAHTVATAKMYEHAQIQTDLKATPLNVGMMKRARNMRSNVDTIVPGGYQMSQDTNGHFLKSIFHMILI